ncbi:3-hydroxyacyl-CoA dehydrogenase/enoyl-CoA hydratase family protein [Azospirillum sp. TSO35-2]|uniref:3-hydroxyacyl-CoA dehydrogenase/enoyl-CoA hydratase family protein n=1 Tax=Azospirillum sp. TSO35-2 TaxID=716796 RepID=UPI000D61FAA2|nr:3-hydroxyacyl-CoA dehydrogenase/enoyl-CoA hydratase family protein [Azospirillum sp. TSO35-2]PWC39484.1 3-hydroxyacyl-CoA dehydrogenase [Azospirillum sp. TSO35-2]
MERAVRKVAVIGAGSMGSGIAAQFANGGVPVLLLDVAGPGEDRAAPARAGLERQLKAQGFMAPSAATLVEVGCIEDDLAAVANADWIVEAVVEDPAVKRRLFARLDALRKPGAAVSSNTSTIPLAQLTDGASEAFRRDFVITHFFNPPRHMRLMELVTGPDTAPETAALVRDAAETVLGKTVVDCRDTPAFIANRLGCHWMSVAAIEALRHGLTVEQADAVAGAPFGVPRTGIFGLLDLVGIDLVPLVWGSLLGALPGGDAHHRHDLTAEPLIRRLIAEGRIGRKAKGGFYRLAPGSKAREALDLATGEYRPQADAAANRDLAALIRQEDAAGRYAWAVLSNSIAYTAAVAGEIADDVAAIDTAMRLGYGWAEGPFALADRVGCAAIADRLAAEGRDVPPLLAAAAAQGGFYRRTDTGRETRTTAGAWTPARRPQGVLDLAEVKEHGPRFAGNGSASVWDLGDGVACLEFHTKMNAIDHGILAMVAEAAERVPAEFRALVLYNDNPRAFSAGANLGYFVERLEAEDFTALERFVADGQAAFRALKHAAIPVVGAPAGLAVGGGCEVLLHCDAIQAHAETYIGLVELKVGIVPGWRGTAELLLRWGRRTDRPAGPMGAAQAAFETIAGARITGSALEARTLGYLRPEDGITMGRDRLLGDAKANAIALAEGYRAPGVGVVVLPGLAERENLRAIVQGWRQGGRASPHDELVADWLAGVCCGGPEAGPQTPIDEDALAALEREALSALVREPATRARIRHMLDVGKPLRN